MNHQDKPAATLPLAEGLDHHHPVGLPRDRDPYAMRILQKQGSFLLLLTILLLVVWQAPPQHVFEGLSRYTWLHVVLETFSTVVAGLVFGVAWNAYSQERPGNVVFLATGMLATGLLNVAHMLSYAGMPDFVTPADPEKAINFWLASRYLFAGILLWVAFRAWAPLRRPALRYVYLAGQLAIVAVVLWIGLFHQDKLPRTFIQGQGLTPVKIAAEYVLVALYLIAAVGFLLAPRRQANYKLHSLFVAASVSVLAELCFTLYSDVTDIFNLLGHVYNVLAYGFIYHALFLASVREPFERLVRAEAQTRTASVYAHSLIEASLDPLMTVSGSGKITGVNQAAEEVTGLPRTLLVGSDFAGHFTEPDKARALHRTAMQQEGARDQALVIRRADGQETHVLCNASVYRDDSGNVAGVFVAARDVSAIRRAERALRTLSAVNDKLIHVQDEPALLKEVCRVIVDIGGYRMAWVGKAMRDAQRTVQVLACHGAEDGFFAAVKCNWADNETGRGPTGTAIRTGVTQIDQDIASNASDVQWRAEAVKRGYRASISFPLRDAAGVHGVLVIYAAEPNAFGTGDVRLLQELADDLAFGIATLRMRAELDRMTAIQHEHDVVLRASLIESIQAIATTLEFRDPYTAGHQRRVAALASAIARELALPESTVEGIHLAASIHDVGKIHIPSEILNKPGKISPIELELIKTHAQAGHDIVKDVRFPWPIARIILEHHERLDGSGYPNRLKGEEILLESRIVTVADVVEAMMSHRPYRPGLGLEKALAYIEQYRGTWFDPQAVDACLRLFREKQYAFDRQEEVFNTAA